MKMMNGMLTSLFARQRESVLLTLQLFLGSMSEGEAKDKLR